MNKQVFLKVKDELLTEASRILSQRTQAYAEDVDQLANIKQLATEAGIPAGKVWLILFNKGYTTIKKLMKGEVVPGETVTERFADAVNYIILGYALLQETNDPVRVTPRVKDPLAEMEALRKFEEEMEKIKFPRYPHGYHPASPTNPWEILLKDNLELLGLGKER